MAFSLSTIAAGFAPEFRHVRAPARAGGILFVDRDDERERTAVQLALRSAVSRAGYGDLHGDLLRRHSAGSADYRFARRRDRPALVLLVGGGLNLITVIGILVCFHTKGMRIRLRIA